MELCPKCGKMTAETNHNNGKLICYNRYCEQKPKGMFKRCKKCKGYGYIAERIQVDWAADEKTYNNSSRRILMSCQDCDGTGKVTWTSNIIGK